MAKMISSKSAFGFGCVTVAALAALLGGCAMSAGEPQENSEEKAPAAPTESAAPTTPAAGHRITTEISGTTPATCHYVGSIDGCTEVQVCYGSTGGVGWDSYYYYTGLCGGVYTTWGDPLCSGGVCRDVGPSSPQ